MNTNISIVMYTKEPADLEMTAMMTFIDLRALKRRATLNTLNVLKTLTVLNADRLPPCPPRAPIISSMTERLTTDPSSQFILSAKYFLGPIAATFDDNSPMKTHVKTYP